MAARNMGFDPAINPVLDAGWSAELKAMIRQLQSETLALVLAALAGLGLLLLGNAPGFVNAGWTLATAAALLLLAGLVWLIGRWSYAAGVWLLVIGCVLIDILAVRWADQTLALVLLAVPTGLATLAISRRAGLATAAGVSLLLLGAPEPFLPDLHGLRTITGLLVWSTLGMMWLLLRPLLTTTQWAWSGYQSSQSSLEQARDVQVELKQAIEDLNAANAQLVRLNKQAQGLRQVAEEERRTKERFVANVSHELRTPLNMIIGFCEMITEAPEAYGQNIPGTLLADLNVVLRNSQHLSALIDDVLDLSQIDAGQAALSKERVALHEIVQAAVTAVRPLYASKNLRLVTEVPNDLPELLCDRTRIREVVLNLLSNAGRYTDQGEVRVRAWQGGSNIITSVTDMGPGIAKEAQERLFQPFQQLAEGGDRRRGGTGLGLSISASFVELHGGRMWVQSEPGQGATFYFRLPIDPPAPLERSVLTRFNRYEPYEERPRRPRPPAVEVRPRLAVIETGNSLQRLLNRRLEGVEVVPAASLEQALHEMAQAPVQALVINAPHVSQMLARLDAETLPPGAPALVCAVPEVEQAVEALGAVDYLLKPIAREALWAALDHLGQAKPVKTVLVVDDEPDALQLFGRMLRTGGRDCRVLRAANGREALEMLRWQHPDVILLDLVMPEMDGYHFLEAMRQNAAVRDIPVILISARDPLGQPLMSNALAVTCREGLSAQQLLLCIQTLTTILSRVDPPGGPTQSAAPDG